MKTTLGGDRLGSGNKQEISMRNYNRSTHDLSYAWRSSMSSGTLVPFMSLPALPGDKFDIDLNCHVLTLPTIGPLFGSYKVQLDVFKVPIRLYNGKLHMNMLDVGLKMENIHLPQIGVKARCNQDQADQDYSDNAQVGSSCILKYLGISGNGTNVQIQPEEQTAYRYFNALPLLMYWDIFKNYYSNKQETHAIVIHTGLETIEESLTAIEAYFIRRENGVPVRKNILNTTTAVNAVIEEALIIVFPDNAYEPYLDNIILENDGGPEQINVLFNNVIWSPIGEGQNRAERAQNMVIASGYTGTSQNEDWIYNAISVTPNNTNEVPINLTKFPLKNIDKMKLEILKDVENVGAFIVNDVDLTPYSYLDEEWGEDDELQLSIWKTQEGLAVKTFQSDLFNNWIDTEWIDGENGINAVTAVDTTGDSFTIDALNLASKVYVMLNRIAISGGTYDDWISAVYTEDRKRGVETPVYLGGLIKELTFEEVVSQTQTEEQPLGTLAGRGQLTNKHKGGKISVQCDEPCYIMGIVSITPRLDYSQGNRWDMNLKTMDDFHKPQLDAIGFQDLITDQMHWSSSKWNSATGTVEFKSAGKQPAWINYMTDYNRTFGNFAEPTKEMFMTLNRRYEVDMSDGNWGNILDLTTYIDPAKFNNIFAETRLDAQNFWVQIGVGNTARRLMSAKIIPNL